MLSLPPLSLYIHIPWCVRKCPYCDFNSHRSPDDLPEDDYVDALLEDLESDRVHAQGRPLRSIFIGGGTPSLFSPRAYQRLLAGIRQAVPFDDNLEITLEANPGTFEQEKFSAYRAAGINRLSIGIQSFNPLHLQALGRIHDDTEALRAAAIARRAGFDNLNLDLMFGLPGQSRREALDDLRRAADCAPAHLSWYQLTIEPNTEFYRRPPPLPGDDALAAMQEEGQALLARAGYRQYEISAYSQPGRACAHNLNYWTFGDYLGIGAGAHGKLTHPEQGRILRTRKTRQPNHYLDRQRPFTARVEAVPARELPLEFMMNALRLHQGADSEAYESRTGLPFAAIADKLDTLHDKGLLARREGQFSPSARGRRFLNELLLEFL